MSSSLISKVLRDTDGAFLHSNMWTRKKKTNDTIPNADETKSSTVSLLNARIIAGTASAMR